MPAHTISSNDKLKQQPQPTGMLMSKIQIHNQTPWDVTLRQRYCAEALTIETEPAGTISANTTGNGGKYDAQTGPYGVSMLIAYNSPDPDWTLAFVFVMPYIGSNSCEVSIVSSDTSIDGTLFNTIDASDITATSQSDLTIDGKKYTFTISGTIGGGTTPTADFYINDVAA